jgi:hypothetical protein
LLLFSAIAEDSRNTVCKFSDKLSGFSDLANHKFSCFFGSFKAKRICRLAGYSDKPATKQMVFAEAHPTDMLQWQKQLIEYGKAELSN